ncbi:MAG TPA: hypothetical protein VG125_09870 [Pirellulales bacterium]|jgi:hypothetical protein|nr:hypothetical protein [Pirellulales bacterium]
MLAIHTAVLLFAATTNAGDVPLIIDAPMPPPAWALLERELLLANTRACDEFFARYFDERGYLLCVERWGGDDGPDDAIENVNDWPLLHALGAPDRILALYTKAWEGHLRQYTQARTREVEFARDGMYYKEFPVLFDWLHNGEGLTVFNLQGLSEPDDARFQQRVRRYAGFYTGEDPGAANYDPEHKVIRSLFNGSRGPLLRKATALDWAGDAIEVEGRFRPGHGERTYAEMLAHFKDYNDILGDHPQNLLATSLVLNAYMLGHEPKYRQWLLEYVDAWAERAAANGGVLPSNVGRDGQIGGECGGRWYGGVYGWGFTVVDPVTQKPVHRNTTHLAVTGFGNALLLTGDERYVDIWRRQIEAVNSHARQVDGRTVYPRMHGDQGWYAFEPEKYSQGAAAVYYWSMDPADRGRVSSPWLDYLQGKRPAFPVEALERDFETIRRKVAGQRADSTTPDTRLADDPMQFNPATVETLVNLALGGLHPGHQGSPLHCRVRYFDPVRRRAGLPDDVAALVEKLTAESTTLTLVNVNQSQPRTVIVQGGAYGEHQFVDVECAGKTLTIDDNSFAVTLAPGAGGRLTIATHRYANRPTLRWPFPAPSLRSFNR